MRVRGGQGEALAVWAVWSVTLLLVLATYSRIDAGELYPGLKPVTLATLLLAALAAWLSTRERAILRR